MGLPISPIASKSRPHTTLWTLDYAGRVLTETNALNISASYTYDGLGRLLTATDRMGSSTTYSYDALGRLLKHLTFPRDFSVYFY